MYTLAKRFLVYSHLLMKGKPNQIFFLKNKILNFFKNNLLQTVLKSLWSEFLELCEDAKLISE